jgi:F-type H+-transporting ATPase subunit beta
MVVFSRDIYQQGRLPAIDLLASTSAALTPDVVGQQHYTTYIAAKKLLEQAVAVERLVSMVGLSDLSSDDQVTYKRAQILKNYLTQSFFVSAVQTGKPGTFVPRMTCVQDVADILQGTFDSTDPERFLQGGSLAELQLH